jgi:hypothetical protein
MDLEPKGELTYLFHKHHCWCWRGEIQTFNLKLNQGEVKDGEAIKPSIKNLGRSETYA